MLFVLQAIYDTAGERPTHSSYPCGTKLDSITQYEKDLTVNCGVTKLQSAVDYQHTCKKFRVEIMWQYS